MVTPGRLPVLAQARPAKLLINVDFPTFGIPTTIARTGRVDDSSPSVTLRLFFTGFLDHSLYFLHAASGSGIQLHHEEPLCFKSCCPGIVPTLAGKIRLVEQNQSCFPFARSSMSGLRLDIGALASTSSITRSISFIFPCIIRRAFVICPGYH